MMAPASNDVAIVLLIFISRMILYLSSNPLSKILEHLKVNFSKDSVSPKTILEIVTIGQIWTVESICSFMVEHIVSLAVMIIQKNSSSQMASS